MVLLLEFRIPMPLTVDEYQIGQLYSVAEASRENTKGDTGVEIIANTPFDDEHGVGQYTHKIYHMGSKVPSIVSALLPASCLTLVEKAWNAYPHCRTEFENPFLGERFKVTLDSKHVGDDRGDSENVFGLSKAELAKRKVLNINISSDKVDDNPVEREPSLFLSNKTNRGNLKDDWHLEQKPIMCCYKLVHIKFQVFGLQGKVEGILQKQQTSLLTKFHKEIFCRIDQWHDLTLDDIRVIEEEIKNELNKKVSDLGLVEESNDNSSETAHSQP